ncbi:MAG: aminopeptidase N C-terminal domain-containing protein, partial [Candidatus Heimdallarchaeota archaeon]
MNLIKIRYPEIDTKIDLGRLIAFHKRPGLAKEVEIRLSTYFPFDNPEAYLKFCNTEFRFDSQRPRITNYFGLNLWVDNESPYLKSSSATYDRRLNIEQDYISAFQKTLINSTLDNAIKAQALALPSESYIANQCDVA